MTDDADHPPRRGYTPATFALLAAAAILPFVLVAVVPAEPLTAWVEEDGIVEWLGATAWLLAGVLFAATALAYRKSASSVPGVFWRGALALMCLLAAGEEISWGQRLFDYDTPAAVAEMNLQKEMNIHNLAVFDSRLEDGGPDKTGLARWLTFGRIGSLIWMGYLIALPLLVRFSGPIERLAAWLQLPVPPPAVAVVGALAYGAFMLLGFLPDEEGLIRAGSNEVKETVVAALFLGSAYAVFRRQGHASVPGRRHASLAPTDKRLP